MKYLLLVVLALGFGLGAHEPKAVRISKIEVKSAVTAQLSPDRSDLVIFANDDFVALETQFKSKRSFNDAVQTKNP
ncbi:hypothetical protein FJ366_04315, partial [Candidatus Dependentiae bacterium]|nr:hypothetical protein [Candidatus Dependentiae bacterium]